MALPKLWDGPTNRNLAHTLQQEHLGFDWLNADCASGIYLGDTALGHAGITLTGSGWEQLAFPEMEVCCFHVTHSPGFQLKVVRPKGLYQFNTGLEIILPGGWAGGVTFQLGLFKNGTLYRLLDEKVPAAADTRLVIGNSAQMYLVTPSAGAGDTADIRLKKNSAGNITLATWNGWADFALTHFGTCGACSP